jgi:hypothetical protein
MNRRCGFVLAGLVLAGLLSPAGYAATVTAIANGAWSAPGTWSAVPQPTDDVSIGAGRTVTADVTTVWMASFTNSGSLVFTGTNTALRATEVALSAGSVTHLPQTATTTNPAGQWVMDHRIWIVCSNLTVGVNASINAAGKGYAGGNSINGAGPGGGLYDANSGRGGGYGGYGGGDPIKRGGVYGSTEAPLDPGSGGSPWAGNYPGGAGGGAILIQASGRVTVAGTIIADGLPGNQYGAAGSGGSLFITCNTLAGTGGMVAANGGTAAQSAGGGGGRVAIVYDTAAQATLNLTTPPMVQFAAGQGYNGPYIPTYPPARPGTLYFSDSSLLNPDKLLGGQLVVPGFTSWSPGSLTISNGLAAFPNGFQLAVTSNLTVTGDGGIEITNGVLRVGGNLQLLNTTSSKGISYLSGSPSESFTVGSNLVIRAGMMHWFGNPTSAAALVVGSNLTLTNAGLLYAYGGATNGVAPDYGTRVTVTGDVIIATNSWIYPYSEPTNGGSVLFQMSNLLIRTGNAGFDANATGYGGSTNYGNGWGPGFGKTPPEGGGGGYGGHGGYGGGGTTYGSAASPLEPGSGGSAANVYPGARGGGLVRLEVASHALINGTIRANGGDGSYGGGGSGGGIRIACRTIAGTNGIVTANGGGSTYGGGGGGRIALLYDTPTQGELNATARPTLLLSANQGNVAKVRDADPGTIYLTDSSFFPVSNLQGGQIVIPGFTSWSPGSLSVSGGRLALPSGLTLTVTNQLTISGNGALDLTNTTLNVGGSLNVNGGWCYLFGSDRICTAAVASLTITNSGQLHVYAASTNPAGPDYGALVTMTGAVTVAANSWIFPWSQPTNGGSPLFRAREVSLMANGGFNAIGTGFGGAPSPGFGYGPGRGGYQGGGGYGGKGGGTAGGVAYGVSNMFISPGSGGGSWDSYQLQYPGGRGGGLIRIEAERTVLVNGTMSANGSAVVNNYGSGGSGGGISIRCKAFTGTNLLSATGGSCNNGGRGGGGRIAVWAQIFNHTVTTAVSAGTGSGGSGDPGTVFWGQLRPPGTVVVVR